MLRTGVSSDEPVQREPEAASGEASVVRRAQMGSAAAFEQLVLSRGPELYRYLAIRLRHEGDARDALQETFTAAWQALPSLREPARFWSWLISIAAHKAADVSRRRLPTGEQTDVLGRADAETVEIRDALDHLPPQFREILLLRFGLCLTEQEAADVLGIRIGTVKSRTARARAALEELLR